MILSVAHSDLERTWPKVKDMLEKGLERVNMKDCYRMEDIYHDIDSSKKQLWIATDGKEINGAIVTAIQSFPTQKRELFVFLLGGNDADKWLSQATETLTNYARGWGCTMISGGGREGWIKKFKKLKGDKFTVQHRFQLEI